ncbi:dynein regulator [Penicillium lividum]|nr:dynein regulator [Penicillium lividum]
MELESCNAALQCALNKLTPTSLLERNVDIQNWLPQNPRYSLESHRETINCIAFHPKFSSIASGSDDSAIKIWEWEHGELEMTLKGHTRPVRDVDYGNTSGGTFLSSCSSDLTIKLWNSADGYENFRTLQGHDHIISAVRFIPTGNLLASASKDADIRLWDVMNGHGVKTIHGHNGWVRDIYPSFEGQLLLSTGDDMTVRLWDISTANPASKLIAVGHENFNMCCAIVPWASFQYLAPLVGLKSSTSAADFMATGSRDKTIKLRDYRGVCIMTLFGHDNWVRAIVFHPGGRYLLSVSDDRTPCCWDLSQQGKCVKILRDTHSGLITCPKWVPGIVKDSRTGSEQRLRSRDLPEVQIRCVIATGSVDQKLYIFAG